MPKKLAASRAHKNHDQTKKHHHQPSINRHPTTKAMNHRSTASSPNQRGSSDQSNSSNSNANIDHDDDLLHKTTDCVTIDTQPKLQPITSYVFALLSILTPELLKHQADHIKQVLQLHVEVVFDERVTSSATRDKSLTRYALTLLGIFCPDLLRPLSARNIEALLQDNYKSVRLPLLQNVQIAINRRQPL